MNPPATVTLRAHEWRAAMTRVHDARWGLTRQIVAARLQHSDQWGLALGACVATNWRGSSPTIRTRLREIAQDVPQTRPWVEALLSALERVPR